LSKLVHGRLRYLEHGELRLVGQSLRKREVLLRLAPHLVRSLRFLVLITRGQSKPAWIMRTGLWLYDQLTLRRALAPSGRLRPPEAKAFPRLCRQYLRAFRHYPDCWFDDTRLTLACQLEARDRGADPELPKEVAAGVLAVKLQHAFKTEDARHAEDFLYRRTKLFIELDSTTGERLARWARVRSGHPSQARGLA
jgi:glycerol-3-phosphate dehydrogenase